MQPDTSVLLCDNLFESAPGELRAVRYAQGRITEIERITAVDAGKLLAEPGETLDLRGKLVLPGLVDAHVHAIATGMLMLGEDCHEFQTLEQLAAAVIRAAAQSVDFIRLGGLDLSRFAPAEAARLNRAWLDGLAPGRPLYIKSVEGHSAWFNAVAWERVGVTPVLERLGISRALAEEMYASGRVHGNAYENLTTPVYDSYTDEERRAGMALVSARAQEVGLTGIHCLEGYGERRRADFELVRDLDAHGDLDLTLYCRDATPELARELGFTRFGGCWCVDGAIGAHSAAVSAPYADKPGHLGELYFSDAELSAWYEPALKLGMQVCVHAIGERALDQALRVLEGLALRYDLHALRPRVDHFVLGTLELAARAERLGVLSAMQPAFDARWGGADGGYAARLGPERALQSNPVGAMQAAGLRIAGSSDSYITPLDPLAGIRAAMYHHNPNMRVSFDAAVRLFSADAAYLAHQEHERGRIAVGYPADFTVITGDRTMQNATPAMTIKAGKVVWKLDE